MISSSGNAAYAVAKATAASAWRGTRLIVFTDVLSPPEMADWLAADFDHVEIEVINDPDASGSHAAARQRAVNAFLASHPGAREISQYGEVGAVGSFWANGYDSMLLEIEAAYPEMTALVLRLGTCATLRSAAAYKIMHNRRWTIIGIDAAGTVVLCPDHGSLNGSTLYDDKFLRLQGFGRLVTFLSRHQSMTASN